MNLAQKFWTVQNFGHEFHDSKNRAWFVANPNAFLDIVTEL